MTTRAKEIAAEEIRWDLSVRESLGLSNEAIYGTRDIARAAFVKGYKHGQQDRWIPVSERLPEEGKYEMSEMVLCQTHKEGIAVLSYSYRYKQWRAWNGDEWPEATHWQPLPSPPNPEQP